MSEPIGTDQQRSFDRRRFLRRAGIGGAVAWAAPAIVTMQPAGAVELTSPPPGEEPDVDPEEDRNPPPGEPGPNGPGGGPGTNGGGGGGTNGGGGGGTNGGGGGGGTNGGGDPDQVRGVSVDAGGNGDSAQVRGTSVRNPEDPAQVRSATASRGRETLPQTGTDVEKLVAGGLTAIAGGTALSLWSAERARNAPDAIAGGDQGAGMTET